jgi:glucose dehydrogenase
VRTTAFAGSDAASSSSVQTLLNAPTPIDKTDVTNLRLAWSTNIPDGGQHTASTIIRNGTMYLSAPHEGVLAPNAGDRKVHRQTPHNPQYVLLYVVNRNVQGCRDTSNSLYSMVALYTDSVVGLDISACTPKIKWYYKTLRSDSNDDDPDIIRTLFEGHVDRRIRPAVAPPNHGGRSTHSASAPDGELRPSSVTDHAKMSTPATASSAPT